MMSPLNQSLKLCPGVGDHSREFDHVLSPLRQSLRAFVLIGGDQPCESGDIRPLLSQSFSTSRR